jgi:amidase
VPAMPPARTHFSLPENTSTKVTDRRRRRSTGIVAAGTLAVSFAAASPALAYNAVPAGNGTTWGVHDAAAPGLDTGSIRDVANSAALRGFGGIRVQVSGGRADAPSQRLNGAMMRGFGLRYDGHSRFRTTAAVDLAGVSISREIRIDRSADWARWFDSFTNTTKRDVTVDVVFGGLTGYDTGNNASRVAETSSGDATISSADSWSLVRGGFGATSGAVNGPSGVVFGTPDPFTGGLLRPVNFLRDSFNLPLATVGHEANFQGYAHRLTLAPGETASLVHFVVVGRSATVATVGAEVDAVRTSLQSLATAPTLADLSTAEICSIQNFDVSAVTIDGFAAADCDDVAPLDRQAAKQLQPATTSSPYDVVGKTITELQADMEAGRTTAQQITRAYLDRIAAYDTGQLGFHSFIHVAEDAMEQARRADERRAKGETGELLGIPVAVKDLYDTKDMPTTNGSQAFDGFRPTKDAFQIAKLREAGAIILGKANMAEYANSGYFSESAWGQVWNAFNPSNSSIGSSGGSAVATALSFAGISMGSQTGDSLWGPSSAASLYSLRGTDGMQSLSGVMPLTFLNDYAGAIARSIPDLASFLNVTSGTDPNDFLTAEADARRPADWRTALDPDALRGKTIGYVPATFDDPFGTSGTSDAMLSAFRGFRDAGATVKVIPAPPSAPPLPSGIDRGYEGWKRWIDDHPESAYKDPVDIITSQDRLPYSRRASYTGSGPMTDAEVQAVVDQRTEYKRRLGQWMDENGVDAVVYAGLLSDVHPNDGVTPSFGRIDPPSSASGAPTVIFPAGVNDHDEPINLQLLGRAWDDAKLLGYAYAFDRVFQGHVEPDTAPRLPYEPGVTPPPIVIEKPIEPVTQAPKPDPDTNTTAVVPGPSAPAGGSGAGVKAAATAKANPRFALRATTTKASSSGRYALRLSCAKGAESCKVRVTVRRGGKAVGARTVTVKAGRTVTVRLRANAAMRRSLDRGSKLRLRVTLRDATGATRSTTKQVVLR